MTDRRQQLEEVGRLTALLIEGAIQPDDRRRLEAMLLADDALLDYYQDYVDVHCLLHWQHGLESQGSGIRGQGSEDGIRDLEHQGLAASADSGRGVESRESRVEWESSVSVESEEWREESEIPRPKTQDLRPEFPNPQIPTLHSPLSTLHSWAFSYAVATLLLSIALLGAWFSSITHHDADALANNNSRRVTPSGGSANETPQFTFVGHVSGMVDCQFAESSTETVAGAGVTLGRRYALRSGLMEISYDTGAKVILQGPCEYTVESRSSGYLHVGKLVAKVESQESRVESKAESGKRKADTSGQWSVVSGQSNERGERREESAGNQQSEIINHKSPALTLALSQGERGPNFTSSRPSTLNFRLFAVRTPTAMVEDLGTEFGVEVSATGETASHVFAGRVVMRTEGRREKEEGREGDNSQSEIQHPTSEILLSAGQAARVQPKDKSPATMPFEPKHFVRRLAPPAESPAEAAYSRAVLADRPLGYWPLNEPVGTRYFRDRSGNRFHGAAMGQVAAGQDGPLLGQSRAVGLSGQGYIDIGRQDRFALANGFTVEAWVWIDRPTGKHGRVISAGPCDRLHQISGWALGYCGMTDPATQGEEPYCTFTRYGEPGTIYHRQKTPLQKWMHLTFVFDRDNSGRIYRNGELWGEFPAGMPAETGPTWVAIGWGGNLGGEYWRGRLAHVAVYPTPLEQKQLQAHRRCMEAATDK